MRVVFFLFLIFNFLFASESVKTLLDEIEKNEDLSLKTKKESMGISYVITRYQLDMMQARTLKDVLKNTMVGYNISRFGVVDPWRSNNLPYSSNGIKIFIDNQEITTARYDNGLFLFGNLNLSFVDHIEVYYLSPSYSISTEPAYVIIKLYSKNPKRDEGKKLSFTYGSYGSNTQTFEYATSKKNFYTCFSRSEVNHKKVNIDTKSVSRDNKNYHFLLTYNKRNTKVLLSGIIQKQVPFMGISWDGKLDNGKEEFKDLHFGIENSSLGFNFNYMLDYMRDSASFSESTGLYLKPISTFPYFIPIYDVVSEGYGIINTFRMDKKYENDTSKIIYGLNYRNKKMNYNYVKVNGREVDYKGMKKQNVISLFLENNIQLLQNYVLTLGYEYSKYLNDNTSDYTLNQYKVSSTYLMNKDNIFKLGYQHIEYSVPPYIYKTFYGNNDLKPQKNDVVMLKYKTFLNEENELELIGFYGINRNFPVMQKDGTLKSSNEKIYLKMFDVRFRKNYNVLNDFIIDLNYIKIKNSILDTTWKIIVLNTHRYKKLDFFENVIYKKNRYETPIKIRKNGFDVSLGVKYNYNKNLTLSAKVENLFDSAYENSFLRIKNLNPVNIDKTDIQVIDKKFECGLEYWF